MEILSDTASSKHDRYVFEVMKAQDESISKVLDWFNRSSDTSDGQSSPVGMPESSKGTSSDLIIHSGVNEEESGPNENNVTSAPLIAATTDSNFGQEIPEISEEPQSRSSLNSTHSINQNSSDIPNVQLLGPFNNEENKTVPFGQRNLNSNTDGLLEFGKSGGGTGKLSNQEEILMQGDAQIPEAQVLDFLKEGNGDLDAKDQPQITSVENIPMTTDSMSNEEIPEESHSRFSFSSSESDDDHSELPEVELKTPVNESESKSPPVEMNYHFEPTNLLAFGSSGGGSGKMSTSNQDLSEVAEKPQSRLSSSSTESSDRDQSGDEDIELRTPVNVMEDQSVPPEQMNSSLGTGYPLKFGTSEGGSGKMSSPVDRVLETDIQSPQVKDSAVFDSNKDMKAEGVLIQSLSEKPKKPIAVEVDTPNLIQERGQLVAVGPQSIEQEDALQGSTSQDLVKFTVPQRKVSDMKQLWEGDRSSQPEIKKSVLSSNSSKRIFSSSEISLPPRTSSVDSDQSSSSVVTFKKVMVDEEEENPFSPIDKLKSFWEKEKNEPVNVKASDKSVKNGDLDVDKNVVIPDSTFKFKKRHTFQSFFEKEQEASIDKNLPERSVSLNENGYDGKQDHPKANTFQSLRSFWNVDPKLKSNNAISNVQTLSDSKNKQFSSTPDVSRGSFVAKIKSKLDSKSLEDIREDAQTTSQFQPGEAKFHRKNKAPLLKTLSKEKSNDSSPSNAIEGQEAFLVAKNDSSSRDSEMPSLSFKPIPKKSENQPEMPDVTTGGKLPGDSGEPRRKLFIVKQNGIDEKSPVGSDVSVSLGNSCVDFTENVGMAKNDNHEQINETVEKTIVPPRSDSGDFDGGLQSLYRESLEEFPMLNAVPNQKEYMDIQEPTENVSKVLSIESNIQRRPSTDKKTFSSQPIVINISSKKMNSAEVYRPFRITPSEVGTTKAELFHITNGTSPSQSNQREETENTIQLARLSLADSTKDEEITFEKPTFNQNGYKETKAFVAEKAEENKGGLILPEEKCKKEIEERIEMPTIMPRAPFNYFDEGLKNLYNELQDSKPALTTMTAEPELSINESAASVYQPPEEEIGGTIVFTKISQPKSSDLLQIEAMNDEEGSVVENVPSLHMTSEAAQPRFSEYTMVEGIASDIPTKRKEASVQEKVEALRNLESQESTSETYLTFTDLKQSTPAMEKNSSLRRSTLELYLEPPYRREMSKSIDFELDQINASSPTEDTTGPVENSFPENAEKFKRMSQSVPAFLQDEICPCAPDVLTDGRDTDSASESSFQIGRHKKSPSSLTNLSGSSGMASMSSVSGSVMSVYSGDFGNVDVKGGIEFQVVYMDQLKEFFIYVYQCKDLAAADVKKQRSDPYVKAYLLPEKAKMGKRKTAVKKKTLDPVYNEILKYKIPKQSLLAQTLNLSVWHHDALGRNSFLGEVNLNLATVDWDNKDRAWYQLQPRTPSAGIGLENRGEMKLSLKYVPRIPSETNTKAPLTGEVHIWIRECVQLPKLRDKINSFVKCTVLPDTSRKSRQKTRTVDKTPNPIFNHTMVYDGFKTEDLREACVELTVWDHNRLSNHFLGGLRIGLGSGKSYGTVVDWMDSTHEESTMWEKMMASPNIWVDGMLPLRMFKMAKLAK
ncbi:synaptotagmin-like protein 2 isoform X9 [Hyperolius riggenbachi]|uniref:synaptotagmin-like protein 2 isoform X9 n=1 Tax=Hyperolius riggenbachi TaxID=752182 RepID=UPI0035A3A66D